MVKHGEVRASSAGAAERTRRDGIRNPVCE